MLCLIYFISFCDTLFRFVSSFFVSFRCVSFHFVSFRFVFVSQFSSTNIVMWPSVNMWVGEIGVLELITKIVYDHSHLKFQR